VGGDQQIDLDGAGQAGLDVSPAEVIGVLGAGTMGAGIAQLACRAGARTLLHDPFPQALAKGVERVAQGIEREVARGRLDAQEASAAAARLEPVQDMAAFERCALVIEAVPERLALKHEIYERLSGIVGEQCVLASNTSSIPVTAIAAAATFPERVVGMHFFNPAPVMRLVEVIAGMRSGERALALAQATGEAMGKTVIRAQDGPGFIVNRCNRPFGLEALRLLAERVADVQTIDRICRMHGGFPMGPFELMDLVGVDTGFEVSLSFYEQSFGEPRWRPSPIAARYVAAGLHGRKSGGGYYDYAGLAGGGSYRPADPAPLQSPAPGEGVVVIAGMLPVAQELRAAAEAAGYRVIGPDTHLEDELPALFVDCDPAATLAGAESAHGARRAAHRAPGGAHLVLCAAGTLGALEPMGSAVGFHVLPPLAGAGLAELTRTPSSSPLAAQRAERFFDALGMHTAWAGDVPGLVLGRIVCQVINEAAFALGEGVGSARDIDLGMELGLGHPRGPLQWAELIGLDHVVTVLDALWEIYREERYRAAPLLRSLMAEGRVGAGRGECFPRT